MIHFEKGDDEKTDDYEIETVNSGANVTRKNVDPKWEWLTKNWEWSVE